MSAHLNIIIDIADNDDLSAQLVFGSGTKPGSDEPCTGQELAYVNYLAAAAQAVINVPVDSLTDLEKQQVIYMDLTGLFTDAILKTFRVEAEKRGKGNGHGGEKSDNTDKVPGQ